MYRVRECCGVGSVFMFSVECHISPYPLWNLAQQIIY